MKNVKIALLQIKGIELDIERNRMIADKYCRMAAESGADIAVFPEMFSIVFELELMKMLWQLLFVILHPQLKMEIAL